MDPVNDIFEKYKIPGPWEPLKATGIANRIYATQDVVLRIATDHEVSIPDALTESVAAPAARAAGIKTPKLIAFDNSRELIDKPFSIWERIHGETLGLLEKRPGEMVDTWRQVGEQLALLHTSMHACPDPDDYLDKPSREPIPEAFLNGEVANGHLTIQEGRDVKAFVDLLHPMLPEIDEKRFLHYDLHAMNLMCTKDGELLALLDWGDAGWGDPVLDFFIMEMEVIPYVLEGYRKSAAALLGEKPEIRIVWGQLANRLWKRKEGKKIELGLDGLKKILHQGI